jgi:DNA-binding Xre family transcriptional regulator
MTRSLWVSRGVIEKVKLSLRRNFPNQKALAEAIGLAPATVNNFFTGKPIDRPNFEEICEQLGLQWREVADLSNPSPRNEKNLGFSRSEPDSYVERVPYESQCYDVILQPGALIRIKAPQQMGKTLLSERLLEKVALKGYRTASLSLKLADRMHFTYLDKFLRWFCTNVSQQLGLASQLDDYWDEEGRGSKVSCTAYFEEYLLQQADTPLVLCLDDVDWLFPYPEIYEDFFALLRSWYEKANSRKLWKRLRLVLIHSTEAYVRLNIEQSPFNVGTSVELQEFNQQEVQDLAKQYQLNWDTTQVKQLMNMVGGHPSLVQQALSHLKIHEDVTLDALLKAAPTESGIYSNHLRSHLLNLQQHPELASALKKVVTAMESVRLETMQGYKLHSMGLVRIQGNEAKPRCNLYRQYFYDRLGDIS